MKSNPLFLCISLDSVHGCGKNYTIDRLIERLQEKGYDPLLMTEMWSIEHGYMQPRKLHGQKNNIDQEIWWYMNWAIRECWTQTLFEQFQTNLYFSEKLDIAPMYQQTEFGYLFDSSTIRFNDSAIIIHNRNWHSVYAYSSTLLTDDIFNKWLLNRLLDIGIQCPFPKMDVILTCSPEVGLQRLTKRSRPTGDDWNEYDMDYWCGVNDKICELAESHSAELYDISEQESSEQVADDIIKKINL